jgi:hypothetical protein
MERELYEIGRRDGRDGEPAVLDNPIYMLGWEHGEAMATAVTEPLTPEEEEERYGNSRDLP